MPMCEYADRLICQLSGGCPRVLLQVNAGSLSKKLPGQPCACHPANALQWLIKCTQVHFNGSLFCNGNVVPLMITSWSLVVKNGCDNYTVVKSLSCNIIDLCATVHCTLVMQQQWPYRRWNAAMSGKNIDLGSTYCQNTTGHHPASWCWLLENYANTLFLHCSCYDEVQKNCCWDNLTELSVTPTEPWIVRYVTVLFVCENVFQSWAKVNMSI